MRLSLLILLLIVAAPIVAQRPAGPILDGPIAAMKPGDYLWAPDLAPVGPVTLLVSLATQRAYAYRNGVPIGVSTVSTGRAGHETPTGIFTVLQKDPTHRSNIYNGAPMPWMQRLTWDGVALHAGKLPGYPDSHGCVRLPAGFARSLFGITRLGVTVIITDRADVPEVLVDDSPMATATADGHAAPSAWRWMPERALAGPVSIVVSGRDKRLTVLRNGVVIGWSAITLDQPVITTAAFTLRAVDGQGTHWVRLPLPGLAVPAGVELTAAERAQGHVPDAFRERLMAVHVPSTTLLVTRDTLATSGTGTKVTVLGTMAH